MGARSAMTGTSMSAYSLVEIMVVLAICVLMAALLLPAIRIVRDSAHSAKCMGNLSQYQLANEVYCLEYHGEYMPAYRSDDMGMQRDGWMSNTDWVGYLTWNRDHFGGATAASALSLSQLCPLSARVGVSTSPVARSYGYNRVRQSVVSTGEVNWIHASTPGLTAKVAWVDALGPDMYLAQANPQLYWPSSWPRLTSPLPEGVIGHVAYRHRNMANAVFFDGHVESMPWNVLYDAVFWY